MSPGFSPQLKVLLADDHRIFRYGFRTLFHDCKEIKLIGEAENGKELLKLVGHTLPDLVFLDIQMPIMNGIETCRILSVEFPSIAVIALTMMGDQESILQMISAGARGFILKNTDRDELIQAALQVHNNGRYYCRVIADQISNMIKTGSYDPHKPPAINLLSEREKEIIRLICKQLSNKDIASRLNLSIRTVESHRENIMYKTGSRNMIGFVLFAIKYGLV